MKKQFFGLRSKASNIVDKNTDVYTVEMFLTDFPQFGKQELIEGEPTVISLIPSALLDQFIAMAADAIQQDRWFDKWRYATGLYIAHYATLYLRSYKDNSETPAQAASSGDLVGIVSSATLGDASVSYDTSAITSATQKWGAWNSTSYGQLLVTEARLVSMGGSFII